MYRLYREEGLSLRLKRPRRNKAAKLRQPKAQDKGGKVLRSATPFTVAYNGGGSVGLSIVAEKAGKAHLKAAWEVLSAAEAASVPERRRPARPEGGGRFLLDLTHEVQRELPHGLTLTMNRAQSGLKALAQVLETWVQHFVGAEVQIQPESRVEDAAWRWHVGLDAEATQLLNDLYEGLEVPAERQRRLVSLFKLRFKDPQHMRADVQGKPVYLGLAMNAEGLVKLKPQNLLLNLPLVRAV